MGCLYSDFSGLCQLHDPDIERPGCDENGSCICEHDPELGLLCEDYQSDGDSEDLE